LLKKKKKKEEEPKRRTLKLHLTDGVQSIAAIEYQSIPDLSTKSPIGLKV